MLWQLPFHIKYGKKSIRKLIDTCLTLAHEHNSTLIYFDVSLYGAQESITETTTPQPNSDQGRVLQEIEDQIETVGKNRLAKTRIITHAYPFGPNVGDGLLSTNFSNMLKKSWLGTRSGKFGVDRQWKREYSNGIHS